MSGIQGRERLQPSLIDRLTDNAPNRAKDGPDGMAFSQAQLRQAVLRDLEHLLNTSNLATIEDLAKTPLAAKSTLNYGIAGFAGLIEQSSRTNTIERELAEAIRIFEPRIRSDTLHVRANEMRDDNALVFEIEGELWAQPLPQKLFLETTIDVETRTVTVSELRQAR